MAAMELKFEADLAEVLGAIALVAALFLWRASSAAGLVAHLKGAMRARRLGDPDPSLRFSLRAMQVRLIVGMVGASATVHALWDTYVHLTRVDFMVSGRVLDMAIQAQHLEDIGQQRIHAIGIMFAAMIMLMADWALEVLLPNRARGHEVADSGRAYVIHPAWSSAPEAMWEWRIARAGELLGVVTAANDWRTEWRSWAANVGLYQAAVATQERRSRKSLDAL